MMTLRWFLSRTVRHAVQMRRHVRRLVNAQRDVLSPQAINDIQKQLDELSKAVQTNASKEKIAAQMTAVERAANENLKAYPHPALRENVEVFLVAIAVAMGIRTFFLQPFKIPTGSMQPTLYGITSENLIDRRDVTIPNPVARFIKFWINGIGYTHVVAKSDGRLVQAQAAPQRFLLFNLKQTFQLDGQSYTVWFPPDNLFRRASLVDSSGNLIPKFFRKGEDIIKLKVISGDHLFVDRLSYNFRRPDRGEIIVFRTEGIPRIDQDQFYIKRLIAKGGERVSIGNDRHVFINGERLDASTPNFELVYSFQGPPEDSRHSGHVNQLVADTAKLHKELAPFFPDETVTYVVPPDHYFALGDNTVNSLDSRTWGGFPRENVIGKSYFVYWPIGAQNGRPSRFGWSHR